MRYCARNKSPPELRLLDRSIPIRSHPPSGVTGIQFVRATWLVSMRSTGQLLRGARNWLAFATATLSVLRNHISAGSASNRSCQNCLITSFGSLSGCGRISIAAASAISTPRGLGTVATRSEDPTIVGSARKCGTRTAICESSPCLRRVLSTMAWPVPSALATACRSRRKTALDMAECFTPGWPRRASAT